MDYRNHYFLGIIEYLYFIGNVYIGDSDCNTHIKILYVIFDVFRDICRKTGYMQFPQAVLQNTAAIFDSQSYLFIYNMDGNGGFDFFFHLYSYKVHMQKPPAYRISLEFF